MPFTFDIFKRGSKPHIAVGTKGAARARIIDFLSRDRRKAFTVAEIYRGAGYKGKGKPPGSFYIELNKLVKTRKILKKSGLRQTTMIISPFGTFSRSSTIRK